MYYPYFITDTSRLDGLKNCNEPALYPASKFFNLLIALIIASLALVLSGCQPVTLADDDTGNTSDKTAVLYVYNWSEYMPKQILENFEAETGIKVIYGTYESNEQMYNQVTHSTSAPYDLIVPSTYYVKKMSQEGLLQPIDKAKLTNFVQLNPALIHTKIDPNNNYSVPYLWGTTGIAVDAKTVNAASIRHWRDLWQPQFKGQVLLTNDMREVFGMALLALGYSSNSENAQEIKLAYESLVKLMPHVVGFESQAPRLPYMSGVANIGMIWNGEAVMANRAGMSSLHYIYPAEGTLLWIDSFAIPKGARHVEAAHQFINFVLRSENAQIISRNLGYATPNLGARMFMSPATKANTTIYPTAEVLKKAELQTNVSPHALSIYQYYWDQLKQQWQNGHHQLAS
ncbi:MAG: extracellular solute-binding protein [Psychrobacter sp.]|nr:extracellular solute-binding protein [Psychrobacter sp.]